ncbi:MAG: HepT-like ribonuclease domain-containing protein [Cyanobacteria bacterium J06621_8]
MAKHKRSFTLYLKDILESIEKIQANALKGKEAFLEDENMQDSIIRKLEIIGEASNRLPKELLEQYSDAPWGQIVALRNVLIHEYFRVELYLVWALISSQELQKLHEIVAQMLVDTDDTTSE